MIQSRFLIIAFIILTSASFAQENRIIVDFKLSCQQEPVIDTICYYYEDSVGNLQRLLYPVNSKIQFHSNIGSQELHTTSAKLCGDTIVIYMTKQSFGLIIDLFLTIVDSTIMSNLSYWRVPDQSASLRTNTVILKLNKEKYTFGDEIVGDLEIKFDGYLPSEFSSENKKVNGEIRGCFKVALGKLLNSRLKY